MTADIRLRPEAELDLAEAAKWYDEQRSGLGQEFYDEALVTLSAIADMPSMHAVIYRRTRRALMHRFPFGIFYRIDRDFIAVLAVLHGSRHPQRWKSRS